MRKLILGFVAAAVMVALGACQMAERTTAPTPGKVDFNPAQACTITDQADWDALIAEALALYIDGSPSESQAKAKIDNLIHQCSIADYAAAETKAWDLATFTLQKYEQGSLAPGVTQEQVDSFIGALFAAAGVVDPNYTDAWVVEPQDGFQTFVTDDGKASLTISGADVSATTLITAEALPPPGQLISYLNTNLDQYPRYYRFNRIAQDGSTQFIHPVIVAICVLMPDTVSDTVFARLRLGHQNSQNGFSVADSAPPPSVLDCDGDPNTSTRVRSAQTPSTGTAGARLRSGLTTVAPVIIDDSYGTLEERGGVGGLADNFSDFGVVDPYADARGGVGGLADNYRPGTRGAGLAMNLSSTDVAQNTATSTCTTPITALVGSEVPPECRPTVTVQTPIGNTNLFNVPVTFNVTAGGGQIAIMNTDGTCGTFGTTSVGVPTAQYVANGPTQARICWKVGTNPGTNTVFATVAPGGDAPDAEGFIYEGTGAQAGSGITFTATAYRVDPTASATGGTFTYDTQSHPGSGSCTVNGSPVLTPVLTYNPGGASAPVNAGSYELTVTCGDGGVLYNTTTATATITIDPAPTTTTVSCPASVAYDGSAQSPCSAAVSGNGLTSADNPTVTYNPASPTNVGTYTASASFSRTNYVSSNDSKTFDITPASTTVTVTCPTGVAYNGAVQTPCSASVTGPGGLSQSVTVTYSPASPKDAGTYTASASFAAGGNYLGDTDSKQFAITQLSATATAGSATINFGDPVPAIGCTVAGLLAADAGTVTCSTNPPSSPLAGVHTIVPIVSPSIPVNYAMTLVNGTLTVRGYKQVDCFASPVYSVMPPTKAAQRDGSNIPIKCTLTWPNGSAVTNATGDLEVWSAQVDGTPIQRLFTLARAFTPSNSGNYSYGLDTGLPGFVPGGAYYVKAVWNDGSTTTGYFRLK